MQVIRARPPTTTSALVTFSALKWGTTPISAALQATPTSTVRSIATTCLAVLPVTEVVSVRVTSALTANALRSNTQEIVVPPLMTTNVLGACSALKWGTTTTSVVRRATPTSTALSIATIWMGASPATGIVSAKLTLAVVARARTSSMRGILVLRRMMTSAMAPSCVGNATGMTVLTSAVGVDRVPVDLATVVISTGPVGKIALRHPMLTARLVSVPKEAPVMRRTSVVLALLTIFHFCGLLKCVTASAAPPTIINVYSSVWLLVQHLQLRTHS